MENSIQKFIQSPKVLKKFENLLGENANQFVVTLLQVVNDNELLKKATPESIYGAAITSVLLDLPISPNLGYAYIVPFAGKAQFQIGYKGLIQLALRSNQFAKISATDVKESEIAEHNRLTGEITFNWIKQNREKAKTIGYVSYFKLHNGYESTYYMTVDELKQHASKYSQTYKNNKGVWLDNFDGMGKKTVLKLNLKIYAPLTPQLKKAIMLDQAVTFDGKNVYEHPDNKEQVINLDSLINNNKNV